MTDYNKTNSGFYTTYNLVWDPDTLDFVFMEQPAGGGAGGSVNIKNVADAEINPATEETVATLATEATVSTLSLEATQQDVLSAIQNIVGSITPLGAVTSGADIDCSAYDEVLVFSYEAIGGMTAYVNMGSGQQQAVPVFFYSNENTLNSMPFVATDGDPQAYTASSYSAVIQTAGYNTLVLSDFTTSELLAYGVKGKKLVQQIFGPVTLQSPSGAKVNPATEDGNLANIAADASGINGKIHATFGIRTQGYNFEVTGALLNPNDVVTLQGDKRSAGSQEITIYGTYAGVTVSFWKNTQSTGAAPVIAINAATGKAGSSFVLADSTAYNFHIDFGGHPDSVYVQLDAITSGQVDVLTIEASHQQTRLVAAVPIDPVTGASVSPATSTIQTDGSQKTQIVDGNGNELELVKQNDIYAAGNHGIPIFGAADTGLGPDKYVQIRVHDDGSLLGHALDADDNIISPAKEVAASTQTPIDNQGVGDLSLIAASATKYNKLMVLSLTADAYTTFKFKDTSGNLTGVFSVDANRPFNWAGSQYPWVRTSAVNKALTLEVVSGGPVNGVAQLRQDTEA